MKMGTTTDKRSSDQTTGDPRPPLTGDVEIISQRSDKIGGVTVNWTVGRIKPRDCK